MHPFRYIFRIVLLNTREYKTDTAVDTNVSTAVMLVGWRKAEFLVVLTVGADGKCNLIDNNPPV